MFMVGVSLSFSLAKRKLNGASDKALYLHALERALILFVLGMMAQGNLLQFDLSTLHPCYSVLHGIAAGYLVATVVMLWFRPMGQAIVTAAFLILYWILLITVPVPGVGRGVLTPTGNAATYVDHLVLGRFAYGENTWFLSYLGFAASVLIGALAGNLLRSARSAKNKCLLLSAGGVGMVLLGLIWSFWFPIIKLLWTSSFVLVTGGISCLLLAAFYLIVDVRGYRKWAFGFVVIGVNALAVYMATMLFDFRKIGNIFVGHLVPRIGRFGSLLEATAALTIIWLLLYWMYRTKSFVKV
jgi:predicted acyltransferase